MKLSLTRYLHLAKRRLNNFSQEATAISSYFRTTLIKVNIRLLSSSESYMVTIVPYNNMAEHYFLLTASIISRTRSCKSIVSVRSRRVNSIKVHRTLLTLTLQHAAWREIWTRQCLRLVRGSDFNY